MAQLMHWQVTVPSSRRPSPRFGMGSYYRKTVQTRNPLGNLFYNIPLSFYREAPSPLPYPVGTDLLGGVCPAVASGQPCPIATPSAPGTGLSGLGTCPAHASGHGCPLAGMTRRRFRAPRFGMGSLGQQFVDPNTQWSVNSVGTINDNTGTAVYTQDMTPAPGTYGPFTVDSMGNVSEAGLNIWLASGGLQSIPATTIGAPTLPAPAKAAAQSPAAAVAATVPPIAAASASFFAPPTGYTAAPAAAAPVSWWNQTTTLFGTKIANSTLAIIGVVGAISITALSKKKGR